MCGVPYWRAPYTHAYCSAVPLVWGLLRRALLILTWAVVALHAYSPLAITARKKHKTVFLIATVEVFAQNTVWRSQTARLHIVSVRKTGTLIAMT